MTIRATINWTDHTYATKSFEIVDRIPELAEVIEDSAGTFRQTCAGVREITNLIARQDFGDYYTFRFFVVYFDDEILEEDAEDGAAYWEADGESFQYLAIREEIQVEEAIEL